MKSIKETELEALLEGIDIKYKWFGTSVISFIDTEMKSKYYVKECSISIDEETIFKGTYQQYNEVIEYLGNKLLNLCILDVSSVIDGCINLKCAYVDFDKEEEKCQE